MAYTTSRGYHGKCCAFFNSRRADSYNSSFQSGWRDELYESRIHRFFIKINDCYQKDLTYSSGVITEWRPIALAAVLASLGLLCAGCSGINRSIDISPATFLLPGLVESQPVGHPSIPESSFVAKESELTVAQGK